MWGSGAEQEMLEARQKLFPSLLVISQAGIRTRGFKEQNQSDLRLCGIESWLAGGGYKSISPKREYINGADRSVHGGGLYAP